MATDPRTATSVPLNSGTGLLRVVSNTQLDAEQKANEERAAQLQTPVDEFDSALGNYIRKQFDLADWHRQSQGIEKSHLKSLRALRGEYDPEKLAKIKEFNGSEVYSRLTAVKCRGATAILRDIYMNGERPWDLAPTPEPNVPGGVEADIASLVSTEVQTMQMGGAPVDDSMVEERIRQLKHAAKQAAKKQAAKEAEVASNKLDDILIEGGFYDALVDFLSDIPAFDYACIKGPVIRKANDFAWTPQGGVVQDTPKMFWYLPCKVRIIFRQKITGF